MSLLLPPDLKRIRSSQMVNYLNASPCHISDQSRTLLTPRVAPSGHLARADCSRSRLTWTPEASTYVTRAFDNLRTVRHCYCAGRMVAAAEAQLPPHCGPSFLWRPILLPVAFPSFSGSTDAVQRMQGVPAAVVALRHCPVAAARRRMLRLQSHGGR
jgi:hypothetical protein